MYKFNPVTRHLFGSFAALLLPTLTLAALIIGCSAPSPAPPIAPNSAPPATSRPTATPRSNAGDQFSPGASSGFQAQPTMPLPTKPFLDDDDTVSSGIPDTPPGQTTPRPLPPGKTQITGRVTDQNGNPIFGAAVTVPQGTSAVPEMAASTDEDGNYRWVLNPGIYTIAVNADNFQPADAQADTTTQPNVRLDFTLQPN